MVGLGGIAAVGQMAQGAGEAKGGLAGDGVVEPQPAADVLGLLEIAGVIDSAGKIQRRAQAGLGGEIPAGGEGGREDVPAAEAACFPLRSFRAWADTLRVSTVPSAD